MVLDFSTSGISIKNYFQPSQEKTYLQIIDSIEILTKALHNLRHYLVSKYGLKLAKYLDSYLTKLTDIANQEVIAWPCIIIFINQTLNKLPQILYEKSDPDLIITHPSEILSDIFNLSASNKPLTEFFDVCVKSTLQISLKT